MLGKRLWARVLRVDRASIEDLRFDEQRVTTDEGEIIEAAVIVSARTYADDRRRCGICRLRDAQASHESRRAGALRVGSRNTRRSCSFSRYAL